MDNRSTRPRPPAPPPRFPPFSSPSLLSSARRPPLQIHCPPRRLSLPSTLATAAAAAIVGISFSSGTAAPERREKKIGSTVTRLDSGAVPLPSRVSPSPRRSTKLEGCNYNTIIPHPPPASPLRPCLFSRFRECDFCIAKLPALKEDSH